MAKILIFNEQSDLPLIKKSAQLLVQEFLEFKCVETDELAVHFVTKEAICRLHEEFFQDASPTDCITFPIDPPETQKTSYHVLGEVFVCPQTAIDYCQTEGTDPYEECSLYLVHGLLHLLGFDDQSVNDKKAMRAAEAKVLSHLKRHQLLLRN